jgi:integrase
VFNNATGGPLRVNTMMNRFEKLVSVAEGPNIRFHDLR